LIAWLQLFRLPNVFTAAADVMMGFLVTQGTLQPAAYFIPLVAASCLLYLSGMVLNDVFDADIDALERPQRPIPSGRVSLRAASAAGWALLASGILVAWLASSLARDASPGIIATFLAGCIVLYDAVLKRTPFAPLAMGACRMLNVFLGMSLVVAKWGHLLKPFSLQERLIALGLGVYVVGVTIFARTEARESSRPQLAGGLVVLLAGLALLASVPVITSYEPSLVVPRKGWFLLWGALALITGRRCAIAVSSPEPQYVQAAVRHSVQSIIVVDAAVCVGYVSPFWAFAVLALLLPTFLLTQWLNAT
jgi:4-hydroxybenzoate polyprenyltransferase